VALAGATPAARGSSLDKPGPGTEGPGAGHAPFPVGRGHGRARRSVEIDQRPARRLQPRSGRPLATPAAAHRGATAAALSAADQRRRLAGGRGGAGRAGAGGVRPGAARPRDRGHGDRRHGGPLAGRPAGARAGGAAPGPDGHRLLVGAVHGLLRAGAGIAGPAALAAPAGVVPRRAARQQPHAGPGDDLPAATPVRGRPQGELGRLGAAVGAGDLPDRDPHGRAVHAGAGGPLAQHRQMGGGRDRGAGRPCPGRVGRGRPHRRAAGVGHRGDDPAAGVPPVHSQRGVPDHLPAGPRRPPGRRRGARGGDPPRPRRPARPGRRGGQAVRAGRLRRLHPAAHHRQGRPAQAAVRQALRPKPPARRPLVQASAASCCTGGWRTRSRSTPCGGWCSRRTTPWR